MPKAKLKAGDVVEIRRLYNASIVTNQSQLGRMFGVSSYTVNQIVNRKSWRHL